MSSCAVRKLCIWWWWGQQLDVSSCVFGSLVSDLLPSHKISCPLRHAYLSSCRVNFSPPGTTLQCVTMSCIIHVLLSNSYPVYYHKMLWQSNNARFGKTHVTCKASDNYEGFYYFLFSWANQCISGIEQSGVQQALQFDFHDLTICAYQVINEGGYAPLVTLSKLPSIPLPLCHNSLLDVLDFFHSTYTNILLFYSFVSLFIICPFHENTSSMSTGILSVLYFWIVCVSSTWSVFSKYLLNECMNKQMCEYEKIINVVDLPFALWLWSSFHKRGEVYFSALGSWWS